jgi:AraC family transcriptional regulator, transcriptional activator of pobA
MEKIPVFDIWKFDKTQNQQEFYYANRLSVHLQSHKFINQPHAHSDYIIVFFSSGKGIHYIDFEQYEVKAGSVFLLAPGQVHSWELSDDTDGYVFFHTDAFFNQYFLNQKIEDFAFFQFSNNYPLINIPNNQIANFKQYFENILAENSKILEGKTMKILSTINLIYIDLQRLYINIEKPLENENWQRVKLLKRYIDSNFKSLKNPSDYANLMNMSTRHLTRICNEILNKNASKIINDRIILEAKRLLTYGNETIYNIANTLGYDDASYFIKIFKHQTGMSPKVFRNYVFKNK